MRRHQDTELVTEAAARGAAPASVLNRPLPRAVWLPLAMVAALAALLLVLNFNVLHVYQKHFSAEAQEGGMPWAVLSPELDEAALRAQMGSLPLRCHAEPTNLGDRVCYAAMRKVDGYPALTLALFLRRGRLSLAMVHVPWWSHGRAAAAMQQQLGAPRKIMGLQTWNLPQGKVEMNARRSLNPLAWSAIVWTPRGAKP